MPGSRVTLGEMGNNCAMTCRMDTIRYICASFAGRAAVRLWHLPVLILTLQACAIPLDVQGHRGARGLAPENTLAAFDRALKVGVSTLELDIGITADKVPVISHDPALAEAITRDSAGRWLTGKGPLIKSMTLAELQAYDVGRTNPATNYGKQFPQQKAADGQRVPALAALFERTRELGEKRVRFNIETKLSPTAPADTFGPDEFVDILLATIRENAMQERVSIQSFDWRTLKRVQQTAPGVPTVYLTFENANASNVADGSWSAGLRRADFPSVPHMVQAAGGAVWSPNFNNLSESLVKTAQTLRLKVIPWTVNAEADMQRLIHWGVDGIITDYPDRLRNVMQSLGLALPAASAAPQLSGLPD